MSAQLVDLPADILIEVMSGYLLVDDIARLDTAIANRKQREHFLSVLRTPGVVFRSPVHQPPDYFTYLTTRGVQIDDVNYKMSPLLLSTLSRSNSAQATPRSQSALLSPFSGGKLSRSGSLSLPTSPSGVPQRARSLSFSLQPSSPEAAAQKYSLPSVTKRVRALSMDATSGLTPTEIAAVYQPQGLISKDLERLSITGYKKLEDAQLRPLLDLCTAQTAPHLTALDLSGCWKLSDATLQLVGERLGAQLLDVKLTACFALTSDGLESFFDQTPNLQSLDISYCEEMDDDLLQYLLETCPQLRALKLMACVSLTDEAGTSIARHGQSLQTLDVSNLSQLTDTFLDNLSERPPPPPVTGSYRELGPAFFEYELAQKQAPSPQSVLKELIMDSCAQITTTGVQRLLRQPTIQESLQMLSCRYCAKVQMNVLQEDVHRVQLRRERSRTLSFSI